MNTFSPIVTTLLMLAVLAFQSYILWQSWQNQYIEVFFKGSNKVARRKPRQLEISQSLNDLRIPPGNRLEALQGDRLGQYSIRINNQFRICFKWGTMGPENVEIVDYH